MLRWAILFSASILPLSLGCNSSSVGSPHGTGGQDAGLPDLASVAIPDSTPDELQPADVFIAPDLAQAQDLAPAPDTAPAQVPDVWQAVGRDLGIDAHAGIDGGRSDALEAGRYVLVVVPDTRPALPACLGIDPSWCSIIKGMPEKCDGAEEVKLDGGQWTTYRDACPAWCLLCSP